MNPFYGNRRPSYQKTYAPVTLSDQFKMNTFTILETVAMARMLRQAGYEKICLTGVSMGANMAAAATARMEFPVAAAVCLGPYGPAAAYFGGILKDAIDWDALARSVKEFKGANADPTDYIRKIMDIPDLRNFPPPVDGCEVILIAGRYDKYVPPESVEALHSHWPRSELRMIDASHTGAILLHTGDFRRAVTDSLSRLKPGQFS